MTTEDPDRTVARDPDPNDLLKLLSEQPRHSSQWIEIPGYEIEGELKRGGMGVVYRAKQTGLNRVVALKMILSGVYADASTRARFLLEAESIAALEHPNVVKVFAFGEHAGHPFLAMEFVPGGTLADRIKTDGPLSARAATEYTAKLASAVAHSHSRGVIHRDIKPLNVLLTTEGEPRLADFGLAKVGRDDSDLTGTGAVLGTPAYMSPEQAAGKTHEVGTPTDVYALGAVLYDLLTGQPPFRGDSVAVTLQKVISEEPERPRKLIASIPRDLETICLKCLEKVPAKRYPTAQALADDLLRFLRGEPISVRPAGALERGYKWVKRNKVVSGAGAAVALALLVGSAVSLGFGLEARKQRNEANAATIREQNEKQDAINARNETLQKSTELKHTLAKALLGPVTAKNRDKRLTPYEVDALWRVAQLRRDEVARMFLDEATRTPLACEQLECRAEHIIHAALGLDLSHRDAVDRLFLARFKEPGTRGTEAISLALAVSRSEFSSAETAGVAARVLADHLRGGWSPEEVQPDLFPRAPIIVGQPREEKPPDPRFELAAGVIAAAARMKPAEAAAVCAEIGRVLADALAVATEYVARRQLAALLAGAAARMEPAEAARLCARPTRSLIAALSRGNAHNPELATDLTGIIVWMDSAEAVRILTDAITRGLVGRVPNARRELPEVLAAVTARMEPGAAARARAEVMRLLMNTIPTERDSYPRIQLAAGIQALTGPIEPGTADVHTAAARSLANALMKETNGYAGRDLARPLAAVTARMEPSAAADICAPVARALADTVVAQDKTPAAYQSVESLVSVTARIEPRAAAELCAPVARSLADALAPVLAKRPKTYVQDDLVRALAAIAVRLELGTVTDIYTPVARTLADMLTKETDPAERRQLAEGLVSVTARLEPGAAADICDPVARTLADALDKEVNPVARRQLVEGLGLLASRLEPKVAADFSTRVARALTEWLPKDPNAYTRRQSARLLAAVAVRIESSVAAELLTEALNKSDPHINGNLTEGLAAVALGFSANARERSGAATALVAGAFATPGNALPSLPLLHPSFHLQPKPLSPQMLVELLKHPFCVGEARRAVLDVLEFTYSQKFKDQWAFVEYAGEHQPQLDLLTPPKRP